MRNTKRASMLIALILAAGAAFATPASAGVSFDFFYSNLSHDGHWLVSASYGRVWQPAFYRPGWHPYYDGHWVYTDVGWTWVSDYAWGSIPYHYGTWAFDPYYGWVWIPGQVWAPSWVVFSTGPDYVGWAPVPPEFSIGVSFGHVYCPPDRYVFVDSQHFLASRVRGYAVPVSRNRSLVQHTRVVNDIRVENDVVVNRGPSVREVERWSGRKVAAQSIDRVPRVAPGERFSRRDLRVDSNRLSRGVRASEPVSTERALPGRAPRTERVDALRGRNEALATPRSAARAPQAQSVGPQHQETRPHSRAWSVEPSYRNDGRGKAQAQAQGKTQGPRRAEAAQGKTQGQRKAEEQDKAPGQARRQGRGEDRGRRGR